MGWGRLAGKGDFRNPLTILSDTFEERVKTSVLVENYPAEPFLVERGRNFWRRSPINWSSYPISLMLEYNPDQYDFEFARGGREPDSPIFCSAIKWDATPGYP